MSQRKLELSIVIPSYNTKELLLACLASIKKNTPHTLKYEIIVVDNNSSDGSQEAVRKRYKDVILIKNSKNLGFAKAVNQGWHKAKGEFVLFLNSDTVVQDESFHSLVKYAKAHQEVGAISGKLVLRDGSLDPDCHRGFPTPWSSFTYFLGLEKLFPTSRLFAQYHQGWKNKNSIHEIDSGAGALLLVPRKVLEEIGGWDESYFFYGEDIDLCFRIKERGYKVIFYPSTNVVHYKGASSGLRKETKDIAKPDRENLIKVTKASVEAWKIFYRKFYKDKYPFWITWLVLLGINLKGFFRLLISKFRSL